MTHNSFFSQFLALNRIRPVTSIGNHYTFPILTYSTDAPKGKIRPGGWTESFSPESSFTEHLLPQMVKRADQSRGREEQEEEEGKEGGKTGRVDCYR